MLKSLVGVASLAILFSAGATNADVTITARDFDGDVLFSGGGTLDLSSWEYLLTLPNSVDPQLGFNTVFTGASAGADVYAEPPVDFTVPDFASHLSITIPATFGTGDMSGPFEQSGEWAMVVPIGYSSGDQISSTAFYENVTLAELGLAVGDYTWTWGTATGGSDSYTISVIPAPCTLGLFGCVGLIGARRNRAH